MSVKEQLVYVFTGTLVWFAVKAVAPKAAGFILAALIIGVLVVIAPQMSK
jgi:hypothetical protein